MGNAGKKAVRRMKLASLKPSPENDRLYRPIDRCDPAIVGLADSIREHGLLEPIVATQDGFILSGHRRYVACQLVGLAHVNVRIHPILHDDPGFVPLLRECNRQRNKSFDEILREGVVSAADKEVAYVALLEHRKQNSDLTEFSPTMELNGCKARCQITDAKLPLLRAVLAVCERRRKYLPLTDRVVHYNLLNDPPLKHASKPDSRYRNDLASYKALCEFLARARLEKLIPWEYITDPTRPVTLWSVHPSPEPYIQKELDDFLKNYWRDLQRSQPNHIEIVAEKMTVASSVKRVAMRFCIPVTIGRGYSSLQPRYEMAERFRKSGKEKLILLILSDHDPDGVEIGQSFARSMRDDFEIDNLHALKVALTATQVHDLRLPPNFDAKVSSANYKKFVDLYGTSAYELEAIEPATLEQMLKDAIDRVLDKEAFNREMDQEREDASRLETVRRRVLRVVT